MLRSIHMFLPSKTAARNALTDFLPQCGRDYASGRNYDHGPNETATVSKLSPYTRTRLLPEWEVLSAVLEEHSPSSAGKFIDEVYWRTYWKGWLQLRPTVWENYLKERESLLREYEGHLGYRKAINGETGIECFNSWAKELMEENYLHNHTRMWTASIWIHTLKLPWQLGADWFLRHLIDGDPASNTLSWRWVAGLQTRGKTYLARPDNIRKYTNNRFAVNERLAEQPVELDEPMPPKPRSLPELSSPPRQSRLGLLMTEEDLSAAEWIGQHYELSTHAGFFSEESYADLSIAEPVIQFRKEALQESCNGEVYHNIQSIVEWAASENLQAVVTAEPFTGHWPTILSELRKELEAEGIQLHFIRHWWDATLHPHATKGFFRFKQAIPDALKQLTPQQQELIHHE